MNNRQQDVPLAREMMIHVLRETEDCKPRPDENRFYGMQVDVILSALEAAGFVIVERERDARLRDVAEAAHEYVNMPFGDDRQGDAERVLASCVDALCFGDFLRPLPPASPEQAQPE